MVAKHMDLLCYGEITDSSGCSDHGGSDHAGYHSAALSCCDVVSSLAHGVVVLDNDRRITLANPAAMTMLGLTTRDIGSRWADCVVLHDTHGHRLDSEHELTSQTKKPEPQLPMVFGLNNTQGQRSWLAMTAAALPASTCNPGTLVVSLSDITNHHEATTELAYQATHDDLTGIANRRFIFDWITTALEDNTSHQLAAIIFIDLDKFKNINDSLGHHTGDAVLQIVADRLQQSVRPHDIVARLGGDEFIIALTGPINTTHIHTITTRVHTTLHQPATINHTPLHINASIGITTITPHDHRTLTDILHDADNAMYTAKFDRAGVYRGSIAEQSDAIRLTG